MAEEREVVPPIVLSMPFLISPEKVLADLRQFVFDCVENVLHIILDGVFREMRQQRGHVDVVGLPLFLPPRFVFHFVF